MRPANKKANKVTKDEERRRAEADEEGNVGRGGRQHWLNAAQNEANTYVATVGLLRPAATKMTGGLDSFQLQKLPFVVCAPPACFPV